MFGGGGFLPLLDETLVSVFETGVTVLKDVLSYYTLTIPNDKYM